jgi:Amt family ammonium transporter
LALGGVAERSHLDTNIVFSFFYSVFVYPIFYSWIMGGGWLHEFGAVDFAGSGYLNLLGGSCSLVGAIVVGPRMGVFKLKTTIDQTKATDRVTQNIAKT